MLGMNLKTIRVVGGPLVRASAADVANAESQLWLTFPQGYREYVTTLGEGVLGGSFVRVYPPWGVLRELAGWRERIRQYWFWDKGRKALPKERAFESVLLGDTVNGDELVFHPGKPDRLFVLPREREQIFDAGSDLLAAVEWMCDSGKLTQRFTERNFEPFDSRKEKTPGRPAAAAGGSADTLDAMVADLQKWAERHGLVKAAQRSFKEWLAAYDEPLFGLRKKKVKKQKIKVVLKDQVLVYQPEKYAQPQVVTTLTLVDSETGFHLGEYQLFAQLDGEVSGSGEALMYAQAVALAENWLGVVQE
jgi:hypothetical protein